MIEYKRSIVKKIIESNENLQEILLDIEHPCKKAINYVGLTGYLNINDEILVNTTACTLNLGTGGYHYVMGNLNSRGNKLIGDGHGMKLKYTPSQLKVLFSEEQASPFSRHFHRNLDLNGKLIFTAELHSMLMPMCAYLKYVGPKDIKIACIITDHGALPVRFSKSIALLKSRGLLDRIISTGNAFGGDHECVNIYTALQMAANILDMDVIIITMGPGIMGTGTPFGFSGLEFGLYLEFCYIKKSIPIYVPRISFCDPRKRHYGISHHFINVFCEIIQSPLPIILPHTDLSRMGHMINQLRITSLLKKHPIIIRKGKGIIKSLREYGLDPITMGRGFNDNPEFFHALGASVEYGLELL
ncbi:MAG: DUF3866 family protein [Clostridiales bacterium]|nr:DUF3866 family protein [Clostridiales bacterium]